MFRGFWGGFPYFSPPFGVTNRRWMVAIICPGIWVSPTLQLGVGIPFGIITFYNSERGPPVHCKACDSHTTLKWGELLFMESVSWTQSLPTRTRCWILPFRCYPKVNWLKLFSLRSSLGITLWLLGCDSRKDFGWMDKKTQYRLHPLKNERLDTKNPHNWNQNIRPS